jgi:nucleoside-diphosphate-sugar epimerase
VVVLTSSPTILLREGDGEDRVYNARECDLAPYSHARGGHLHPYSLTKSDGTEAALTLAWGDGSHSTSPVRVCAIAPHQVYGPEDRLFMPNLLGAAAAGRLRVFGPGDNLISMCHTDNAAHAHILAAAALAKGVEGVAGEVFVVSDTGAVYLWDAIGRAVGECGLGGGGEGGLDLVHRPHLGKGLLWVAGQGAALASALWVRLCGGRAFHFSPFSIRMLLIHRFFNVNKAVSRLGYSPLVAHDTAWPAVAKAVWERMQVEGGGVGGGGGGGGGKSKHV